MARWIAGTLGPDIPLHLLRFRAHGAQGEVASWASPDDATLDALAAAARQEGVRYARRSA